MSSWQVRLANLDKEIQNFLENNPEFPIKDERKFVMYAVREEMKRWIKQEEQLENLEQIIDDKVEERLG